MAKKEQEITEVVEEPLHNAQDFITGLVLKDQREIAAAFIDKYDGCRTTAQWQALFDTFIK